MAGKIYICEEAPVKYDAIDTLITMIAAHYLPLFCSFLTHGCLLQSTYSFAFLVESGTGKSTLCKIFSSDHHVISEDMFALECFQNKVMGKSIPTGQKHFWVKNTKSVNIKQIFFSKKAILD